MPKDVLGPTDNLGADALKLSVGEALGLRVDYYVLINLQGFSKMINALGGIKLNINTYIPIGGDTDRGIAPKEFLKPGPNQKLKGVTRSGMHAVATARMTSRGWTGSAA